jgi:hypothetical protein
MISYVLKNKNDDEEEEEAEEFELNTNARDKEEEKVNEFLKEKSEYGFSKNKKYD